MAKTKPKLTRAKIMKLIEAQIRYRKTYRQQAEEAASAARDDATSKNSYNIHWSNTQILRAAVFGSMPKADVRRRFRPTITGDPRIQQQAKEDKDLARMIERAISYQGDINDHLSNAKAVVKNLVEEGLGVPRITYDVDTQPIPDIPEETEQEGFEADEPEGIADDMALPEPTFEQGLEEIVSQQIGIEHIPAEYFHWETGKTTWEAVNWIAYESYQTTEYIEREYGVVIETGDIKAEENRRDENSDSNEVCIYEFMYKPTRTVYVVSPSSNKMLDEYKDKLNLTGFFHSPRPAFSNLKSDELTPKPDYQFIQSQIAELNGLTTRIKAIAKQIKARGYYDSALPELGTLMSSGDGVLMPVTNLVGTLDGADFSKAISYLPLQELVITLRELQAQRREVKEEIFEIIGIADIVRGISRATETAQAQNLKGRWVGVRLQDKIDDIARLWRDTYRMMAEIICEHFEPAQLSAITGIQVTPYMAQVMQGDLSRSFAVDIETDSTIKQDDFEERQQTLELINVLLEKMQQVIPAVREGLLPIPFVQETLLMIVSKYSNGKALEDAIAELQPHLEGLQQLQQQMQQMGQQLQQRDQQAQQMGQQMQQMQKALQQFNQGDEQRKTMEAQAKVKDLNAKAQAQEIENQIVAKEHQIDLAQKAADIDDTRANTEQTRKETALMGII